MIYLVFFSSLAFIFYGVSVLSTDHMGQEFDRYGLSKFRMLTGALELLGGIGLCLGILYKPILSISSLGLCTLMLLGCGVRVRVRDPWYQLIPAFILMIINGYIFSYSLKYSVL